MEWISVKDKLPSSYVNVIGWDSIEEWKIVRFIGYALDKKVPLWQSKDDFTIHITHWFEPDDPFK